jgi:hypothetical protein
VQFPRAHFTNGEKFPVVLRQLCVAPINYQFNIYREVAAGILTPANFRNSGAAAMAFAKISIAAPQRQYYSLRPGIPSMFSPRPTATPTMVGTLGIPLGLDPSSLWGLNRWKFDHEMVIPKLGDLEFELTGYVFDPTFVPAKSPVIPTYIHFEETRAGLFNGNSRDGDFPLQDVGGSSAPFPPDGFGNNLQKGALWPVESRFNARKYAAENPTSSGSIPVSAFSVMIDQQALDAEMQNHTPAKGPGTYPSSLALRIGTRARMRNGGSGAYWWRQGAPLALVTPTLTQAQVYDLRKPITLGPGDSLDLLMEVPLPVDVGQDEPVGSVYQVGVSLCGFAAIEG